MGLTAHGDNLKVYKFGGSSTEPGLGNRGDCPGCALRTKKRKTTGLNRESLYKFVNNPQPTWRTVHKILHALGVKLTCAA
ncbi:MAG: hypothetical protein CSA52_00335 [Gammaproteobacteria bacterium]|nr:MAG: hypothetical protein CSA52_00335 [Gammaproteobacteria bacterium]